MYSRSFIQGFSKIAGPLILMLRISPILIIKLSINLTDDKFDRGDCDKDETKILLASSAFKKSIRAGYLIFGVKKDDQATKKSGNDARGSKYLTLDAKKVFKFLQYTITQAPIF